MLTCSLFLFFLKREMLNDICYLHNNVNVFNIFFLKIKKNKNARHISIVVQFLCS